MAQTNPGDFPIDPQTTSGVTLADILNRFRDSVLTLNSGPTAPSSAGGTLWLDTSGATPVLKIRNAANNGWESPLPLITGPTLELKAPNAGDSVAVRGVKAGLDQWAIQMGNAAGDLEVMRYDAAGAPVGPAITIDKTDGEVKVNSPLLTLAPVAGSPFCNLNLDGLTSNTSVGINLYSAAGQPGFITGFNGGKAQSNRRWQVWMPNQAGNFSINRFDGAGGGANAIEVDYGTGVIGLKGPVEADGGVRCQLGANGTKQTHTYSLEWFNGSALHCWIDTNFVGALQGPSDERVKKDIKRQVAFDADKFLAIRPIRFRFADVGAFTDDGKERLGFSAQQLNGVDPQYVSGDVTAVQANGAPMPASPDRDAILAQTVLGLQDALARIATLEAANGG